jgi:hypothetical protein
VSQTSRPVCLGRMASSDPTNDDARSARNFIHRRRRNRNAASYRGSAGKSAIARLLQNSLPGLRASPTDLDSSNSFRRQRFRNATIRVVGRRDSFRVAERSDRNTHAMDVCLATKALFRTHSYLGWAYNPVRRCSQRTFSSEPVAGSFPPRSPRPNATTYHGV